VEVRSGVVSASGRYQAARDVAAHRRAASPGEPDSGRTTAAAPAKPPKYSTWVADAGSDAGTRRLISRPGPSATVSVPVTPLGPNVVTRTVTGAVPGLAATTHALHPSPPPWGQNHA